MTDEDININKKTNITDYDGTNIIKNNESDEEININK